MEGSSTATMGRDEQRLAPRRRLLPGITVVAALAAALALPQLTTNQFYIHLANLMLLNSIFAVSLGLIASVGQISLGHAAFVAAGAYVSALAALSFKLPPILGIVLAGLVTGLAAVLLGKILLRLRGVYFVLVTFLAGQVFTLIVLNWESVTHGANGLLGIPAISIFGLPLSTRLRFYYFALAAFIIVVTFVWALMRSQYGRAFRSIAENVRLAESSGIDVSHYQIVAFALGSGIAGAAGAATVHYIRFLSPDSFTFNDSIAYITMLVVGGRHTMIGGVLGALFLTPLPELLRGFVGAQHIIYGVILLCVLLFIPNGLVSIGRSFFSKGSETETPK
ncbi:branched-chain amino acid ABC transporter permease [Bradyrhizobium sp. AUGA SZCCT0160]|uniref:branched-chain amino acid ABC transporter permease n=1 Tax=Bradyrhizobium sp. AUGA SZCCT0160 TaxID=2807662 RepID=UPI001BAA2ADE|nr:branched-chain amino acid ABC transporter permease [Bradyrhizobium sp. AUGA SZCCT0160]MBR1192773.1 branched-chain amino acid ABC transporter permease [Bradyrhizobium sp. AUGA SZCCT0160]